MYIIPFNVIKQCVLSTIVLGFLIHKAHAFSTHNTNINEQDKIIQENQVMNKPGLGMPEPKRVGPDEVEPIVLDGVRYEVIHWGKERGLEQNGGYIAAVDIENNQELWIVKIYSITYRSGLETDVQDNFIRSMILSADKASLMIEDENNRQFVLDLKTRQVVEK